MNKKITLIPFFIFISIFIGLNILYPHAEATTIDSFPLFAAMLAIACSFLTFKPGTSANKKIEVLVEGVSQPIVLHMCFIFLLSTVFTFILEKIDGIQAAVDICLQLIPLSMILPGMFLVASLFSFTIGSSMGAIAAFMPIASTIATCLKISPSLMAGIIVSGSMFGDNLSILSDTTIVAVKVTDSSMYEKIKENIRIAFPAFIATVLLLGYINYSNQLICTTYTYTTITNSHLIKVIPYFVAFSLSMYGLDTLIVLFLGSVLASTIGIWLNYFSFLEATSFLFQGFYASRGMVNVFILVLLLSGLSKIIEYNGGIDYILDLIQRKVTSPIQAKLATLLLILSVNTAIAINTISILITGPVAKKINHGKVSSAETATILDIGSCISQGILPYTPQLLLAASMSNVSPLSLVPHVHYLYFLLGSLLTFIFIKKS